MSRPTGHDSAEFETLLSELAATVRDVARELRSVILDLEPRLIETVDAKARVVGYGTAAGYAGLVCTIILSKDGVKLGLPGSATWPDPHRMLEGKGKRHKYLVIGPDRNPRGPDVIAFLRYALAAKTP